VKKLPPGFISNGPVSHMKNACRFAGAGPVRSFADRGVPVLAALYESWSIPVAVMLVVPHERISRSHAPMRRSLATGASPNDVHPG